MSHIFVSYSSQDREFALKLAGDLEKLFQVWIDRDGLEGGAEWQDQIEAAIKDCAVFVVVVSPHSNQSNWVNRETILAERLNKYRVPLLIEGEIPFRLLELQYIDFQGEYMGGMRDLVEVLSNRLEPSRQQETEVNRMLGNGIRAYLNGSLKTANQYIGQALVLDTQIALSLDDFWTKLLGHQISKLAAELMPQITVAETVWPVGQYSDGALLFEWALRVEASDTVLAQIEFVEYTLHPTFNKPSQIIRNRETGFRLVARGWGAFLVPIDIHFEDGSIGQLEHMLTFS